MFVTEGNATIADVAVTKRHRLQDEIRIICTRISSRKPAKLFLRKLCHEITRLTFEAMMFAQHTLTGLLYICAFYIAYACCKSVRRWQKKQLCWFPNIYIPNTVLVKNYKMLLQQHLPFVWSLIGCSYCQFLYRKIRRSVLK